MSARMMFPLISRAMYPLLVSASCLLFVGCSEAESQATLPKGDTTSEVTGQGAEQKTKPAAKVASDETTNAREGETQKPALASEPPTVYEVAQVIDVRKLPRLEVVQSYDQQVGSMYYVAKSDLKTAAAFYEKIYTDRRVETFG